MPLEQLPAELLLQIALHLPDSSTPSHIKNLSLTSRALRPIAQEALFTTAKLCVCCGCRPKGNALIKLLRTTLERPDLACKVKSLRFRAVRKPVDKLYAEQGPGLADLRNRCILKLEELGFQQTHPWWRSINNSIESAFGGLLLALLPQLTDIDFCVKDHQHGTYSSECISGLWGGTSPPKSVLHNWTNVNRLTTGDTSMLKCGIQFKSLTALDLRTISIGTVLRLNGPGSLQGAENITDLALTASIQFTDKKLVEKAEIEFGGLLEALACRVLKTLRITFINDGYNIDDALSPAFNGGYFLGQLHSVRDTLETLAIGIETTDDDDELDWMLYNFKNTNCSLEVFPMLKSLSIPEVFLFTTMSSPPDSRRPWDMPPNLEQLDLLWPSEVAEIWFRWLIGRSRSSSLLDGQSEQPRTLPRHFQKLVLTCNDNVRDGSEDFKHEESNIFRDLWDKCGVVTEIYDQMRNVREILHLLHEQGNDSKDNNNDDNDKTETIILSLLRIRSHLHPSGLTVVQLAEELDINPLQVQKTVAHLHREGRILAPTGLGWGSRVQFFNATANVFLLRLSLQKHFTNARYDGILADERPEHASLNYYLTDDYSDHSSEDDDGPEDDSTDDDMPDLEPVLSILNGPRVAPLSPDLEPRVHVLNGPSVAPLSPDPVPRVSVINGPRVAPLSRVGLVTETAVLRYVRLYGPLNHLNVTYQDIAISLGTHYYEIASRVDSLRLAGHVRAADDKAYFISENDELLREDLSYSID